MAASAALILALVAAVVLAAWFAWRYFRLQRIADELREIARRRAAANSAAVRDPESLPVTYSSLLEDLQGDRSTLKAERDRLAAVLDQMTDGVLIADGQGHIQLANPAARAMFDSPDPIGHTVTEVLRQHQLVAAWQRSVQTDQAESNSVELPSSRQFLHLIVMPDKHAGGSLLLVQDLTRLRRLETIRRDFVSNVSHELRTPLASLKALAETLQAGALSDPEAGPHFLERMVTEVDALTQMAQELLDLSRIESGQAELELHPISAAELLSAAVDRMRVQSERAGVSLRVDSVEDALRVQADRGRLEQVLVNLIHNAIKFNRPGGAVVLNARPAARTTLSGSAVEFSVRDTGIGIAEDDVPRVFERFFRADKARAGSGTGLGLAIAKHVVEAHGGRIWTESVQGQGSTFFFSIPSA